MDYSNFITHGFLAQDAVKEADFYSKHFFPFPRRQDLDTFVELETESPCGLFFWKYDHLAEHLGEEAMKKIKNRSMCAILYETRAEVDAGYEDLKSKGVAFLAPPQEWVWNAYATYFVDPFGYLWELWTWN